MERDRRLTGSHRGQSVSSSISRIPTYALDWTDYWEMRKLVRNRLDADCIDGISRTKRLFDKFSLADGTSELGTV